MTAVLRKALADVRRRRLQTGVICLVTLLSSLAATMALSLLIESDAPYDRAFAQANGPHLVVTFDAARVSALQLAASARAAGVTQAVGPMPATSTQIEFMRRGPGKGPAALGIGSTWSVANAPTWPWTASRWWPAGGPARATRSCSRRASPGPRGTPSATR